ncbi:hypothetical protein SALBM217S_04619 [Streptomyces griseoloalbus]
MGARRAAYRGDRAGRAARAATGELVSPLWLLLAFLLLAAGEVSFAPAGMSATTALAPATFTSQMVALFWLSGALGGGVGGNALEGCRGDRVRGRAHLGYFPSP